MKLTKAQLSAIVRKVHTENEIALQKSFEHVKRTAPEIKMARELQKARNKAAKEYERRYARYNKAIDNVLASASKRLSDPRAVLRASRGYNTILWLDTSNVPGLNKLMDAALIASAEAESVEQVLRALRATK